ncbi:MAG: LLM class flavin-dependent oxidoreductase [Galactobacter sp.]|uniref:LLM class flavin-dependent oxidoreductase n=1 Tax=Galactobacter sp. TaxID=2676125 RepID=UPI0025B9BDD6|nr:LLM class flavin-dependent oxidoreductase [Galactobacter sp.]
MTTLNLSLDTSKLTSATLNSLLNLVTAAEAAGVTSVTLTDRLTGGPTRLDPLIAASALGPVTHRIGLIPEVVSAVSEPFHTATAVQTIDHASLGRAGLALRPGLDPQEHAAFGRWTPEEITAENVYQDAEDTLEAVSRLWDSWQDDAVIRDTATDRFLDRTRIHDAAFEGSRFTVEGASITPRSPQGRPPIVISVTDAASAALAAARGDVAVLTGIEPSGIAALRDAERSHWQTDQLLVWGEAPLTDATDVADVLTRAQAAGLDGVRLVPQDSLYTPVALAAALDGAVPPADNVPQEALPHLRSTLGLAAAPNTYTTREASLV